ncbi:uncharacterized protein LOC106091020 isoform X2 [Stomoxys calcitrans]|uniref:uncharacterized protein LOC106091020 isoform X2 n=1 Tax=Stomoxys calcitrans TaxID=35570 RepID=UPI0027E24430|nr:uncharacterized protein LOC106091020 isoform X2 [Stomoxys calcitrans]
MSEFNGEQFYGFSSNTNPNSMTQTGNFDYRHVRSEFLDSASQKVAKAQTFLEKPLTKPGNTSKRTPTPGNQSERCSFKRDVDVETHIAGSKTHRPQKNHSVRQIPAHEIENLIAKVKALQRNSQMAPKYNHYQNLQSLIRDQDEKNDGGPTSQLVSPNEGRPQGILRKLSQDETYIQPEILNQTYNIPPKSPIPQSPSQNDRTFQKLDFIEASVCKAQTPLIMENVRMEPKPQAKWVEVWEPQKGCRLEREMPRCLSHKSYCTYDKPALSLDPQLSARLMAEVIADNNPMTGSSMNVNPSEDIQSLDNYIVEEDSDLEFEMIDRNNYMKYIEPKPLPEDIINMSVDADGSLAEFIAIESGTKDLDVTYLKNASFIHFTEETQDDIPELKVYLDSKEKQQTKIEEFLQNNLEHFESCEILNSNDPYKRPSKSFSQNKRTRQTLHKQHLQQTFERLAAGGGGGAISSRSCSKNFPAESITSSRNRALRSLSSPRPQPTETGSISEQLPIKKLRKSETQLSLKNLKISKSIENLKLEKSNIYKKMTNTQEKIMEAIDKLRNNLLQLNAPKDSFDKTKRQRNAFEFAVRFSRNFLYPLKGMLDDLKSTPVEQFNSLHSNEACLRVCQLYGLILQSVNTYQKQLRYFFLNHVPEKLPILIEKICEANTECLEKQIFSSQDVVVDGLHQKCSQFFDFLQDFDEERLKMAKEASQHKLTLEKASHNYDLKMCFQDLSMYEPTLVPRAAKNRKRPKLKSKRSIATIPIDEVKDSINEMPKDENITTHIQNVPLESKNSTTQVNLPLGDGDGPGLSKSVIEALQNVTKEQVQQLLQPILASMGKALENQSNNTNPKAVAEILETLENKVFLMLAGRKQLNSDNKCSKEENMDNVAAISEDNMEDTTQTSKPLKAAKQTKTQSQPNNRRSAEAAPPPSTTHNNTVKSGAAYRTAAAAYADNNEDVDDDNSSNIINNNSNKMGKSNNNYMNRNNNNTNTVRQNNSRHSMPHYNGGHWQRGGQAEKESSINKLPMKLMNEVNEDQMDNEFSKLSNDEKDIEELQRSLHKEKILKENNFEQNQNEQPAMRHNDKLSVSLEPKQLQYNSSNDDDCCWDSASSHNIHVNTLLTFRPHTQQVMGKRQRVNHQQRRESSSHTQCQHLTGEKTPSMLSSQTQRIPSLHGLTEMPSEPCNGKFGELYRNKFSNFCFVCSCVCQE